MKIKALFFFALTLIFVSSCTVEEVDPDLAAQITGTYTMNTYVTHSGESTPSANDKIVISRTDDTQVSVLIDYASTSASDVELTNVSVVKSGDKFLLEREFNNATVGGVVEGDELDLSIEYTDGRFLNTIGTK